MKEIIYMHPRQINAEERRENLIEEETLEEKDEKNPLC